MTSPLCLDIGFTILFREFTASGKSKYSLKTNVRFVVSKYVTHILKKVLDINV
jgi:hypothetical protein